MFALWFARGRPSNAVLKVAHEAKVPFFGPMAGSPTFRRPFQPYAFPVRAEHREEFRALMTWGTSTGWKTVGFMHQDTAVGARTSRTCACSPTNLECSSPRFCRSSPTSPMPASTSLAKLVLAKHPDMVFNHGSAGPYAKLLDKGPREDQLHGGQRRFDAAGGATGWKRPAWSSRK